ncbi:universal stress protein [Streptomyces sp. NPDC014805]|uniref:universal stress protein n=1 Tax=Streptomyces sp. NPDC014805 TaxID=3364919 RepID=UPI0036FAC585
MTFPLVVGVDGSQASLEAVDWAAGEAVRRRRVHATAGEREVSEVIGAASQGARRGALQALRRPSVQVLDEALREAAERHRDVPVNSEVVEGAVRRALLDAAADTDLLVVGARWRHGHVGLQLDLVNHVVLHHAPCPIAVVPRT